jgi:predicted transcriptional regulator
MAAMSFFLGRELLAALDKLAAKAHRNRSQEIRELIVCEAERQGIEVEVRDEMAVTSE